MDLSDAIAAEAEGNPSAGGCTPTLPGFTCGLDATLRVIAGKWKPLILYFLAQGGPTRYGELRRAIRDVSDKVLIQQLKDLEGDGLVIGDLRYDRENGLGFSEIEVDSDAEPCPTLVPPWVPPRADLLERRNEPKR